MFNFSTFRLVCINRVSVNISTQLFSNISASTFARLTKLVFYDKYHDDDDDDHHHHHHQMRESKFCLKWVLV
jgi:hypothetical protein